MYKFASRGPTVTEASDVHEYGLVADYRHRTPASAAAFQRARQALPGGETRAVTTYPPHPVLLVEGHGAHLLDVDGNSYLDLVNNYTSLVHGNAFAPVSDAIADLLPNGVAFASPHLTQIELAETLISRIASVQRVRFTNSGTEASLLAARIARRATGRRTLLLFRGAYHGSAEGLHDGDRDVVVSPWNDIARAQSHLATGRIAAVFAEPFLGAGGVVSADPGFLAEVEAAARRHGSLFVLDEVQSLRNHVHGVQASLGLTPDLTLMAKIIGGGFPIGAVGGAEELLDLTVATRTANHVAHAGTFNGHPAAALAGRITLDHLGNDAVVALNEQTETLSNQIEHAALAANVEVRVNRSGSIMNVHTATPRSQAALHIALLLEGVYTTPRGMVNLSTALSATDLADTAAGYRNAMTRMADEVGD